MNLDDLAQSIPDSENVLRHDLARWINGWKKSDASLEELVDLITKWHGNVWFKDPEFSNTFYQNWLHFKTVDIAGVTSMTVNERLYTFGLVELWDTLDEAERAILLAKFSPRGTKIPNP